MKTLFSEFSLELSSHPKGILDWGNFVKRGRKKKAGAENKQAVFNITCSHPSNIQ
jgi:hypothetical protein